MKKLLTILFLLGWYFIYAEYNEPAGSYQHKTMGRIDTLPRSYTIYCYIKTSRKRITSLGYIHKAIIEKFESGGHENIKKKYITIKCISKL